MKKIWLIALVMGVLMPTMVLPVLGYIDGIPEISSGGIIIAGPIPEITPIILPIQIPTPVSEIILPIPPVQTTGLSVTTDKTAYNVGDSIKANVMNNNDYKANIDSIDMINATTGNLVDSYRCMIPEGCGPNTLVHSQRTSVNFKAQNQGQYQIRAQWWRQYDCYPKCLIATKLETSYSKIFTVN